MTSFEFWTLYTTITLAAITAIYTILTYRIMSHTKKQADVMALQTEAMLRPIVNVRTQHNIDQYICLVIENIGNSPAENLKLTIDKDYFFADYLNSTPDPRWNLRRQIPFVNITPKFAPGERFTFPLIEFTDTVYYNDNIEIQRSTNNHKLDLQYDQKVRPRQFIVSAVYNYGAKCYKEDFNINIDTQAGGIIYTDPIAKQIRSLKGTMDAILKELKK